MKKAFCNSIKCVGHISFKPVEKPHAKKGDLECPDCNCILRWQDNIKQKKVTVLRPYKKTSYMKSDIWP